MGRSEKRTDWLGNEYTVHFDDYGDKVGESRKTTDWLGNEHTQHFDVYGDKVGTSEPRTDWLGNKYHQHYDKDYSPTGQSEPRTSLWGNRYSQHYDDEGDAVAQSELRRDWLGNRYEEHDGRPPFFPSPNSTKARPKRSSTASQGNGEVNYSTTSGPALNQSTSEHLEHTSLGVPWVLLLILLLGVGLSTAWTRLEQKYSRNSMILLGPGLPDFKTTAIDTAPVHRGPGEEFSRGSFDIDPGDTVFVECVNHGWCWINTVENMWVRCELLEPPPGGWPANTQGCYPSSKPTC